MIFPALQHGYPNSLLFKQASNEVLCGADLKSYDSDRLVEKPTSLRDAELLDSVQMIPPEILTKIFILSLCPSTGTFSLPFTYSNSPLALMQVCSRWRQIVFRTSEFWCALELMLPDRTHSEVSPALQSVQLISRNSSAPSGFRLRFDFTSGDYFDPAVSRILLPHADRVTHLRLTMENPEQGKVRKTHIIPTLPPANPYSKTSKASRSLTIEYFTRECLEGWYIP